MPDTGTRIPDARRRMLLLVTLLLCARLLAAYDLSQVRIEKLDNGLAVMMLEDHTQPLVSTQVLYKVGARNENNGATGVAHFCEHMAFRATKNFPNTDVVSRIYAIGGEWHGYTWIDETTYFETVPREDLDLTLQIQADRMANALIKNDEIEAERGAVLTELHGYENDPASVLNDAVNEVVFLEHPYRNNTVGWTSDVEKLTHDDIANFYHRYYNPSNAVLAIAGDIDPEKTLTLVKQHFGSIPAGPSDTLPRTVEPPQHGERRIQVNGSGSFDYFQIAYRAPAARDPDFPAFLVLQAILGGSAGVNFQQQEEAEPAHPGTRLAEITDEISTYFVPTADPYAFSITGRIASSADRTQTEDAIEKQIAKLRWDAVGEDELARAKKQLRDELIYDIQTTRDAAHQMAYFEGIGAFPVLQSLSRTIDTLTSDHIQQVAQKYLQPAQRTIGWYVPATSPAPAKIESATLPTPATAAAEAVQVPMPPSTEPPRTLRLKNGVTLIVKHMWRTPTGFLRILLPTNTVEADAPLTPDRPMWGYTSIHFRFLKGDLAATITKARKIMDEPFRTATPDPASHEDPESRLNLLIHEMLGAKAARPAAFPAVIAVVGDINETDTLSQLKTAFSNLKPQRYAPATAFHLVDKNKTVLLPGKAQSEVGYFFPAPAPADRASDPYRLLLYIMVHNYEGRLGKELINKTGLIYFIDGRYFSNGPLGWISVSYGVDPGKLEATQQAFTGVMNQLSEHPPTAEEVAEAKENLIGRRHTAYQSDEELSAFYAREWIEQGRLLSDSEFEKRMRSVTLDHVRQIVPVFLKGSTAMVDTR